MPKRILYVEDSEVDAVIVDRLARQRGYSIDWVGSASESYQQVQCNDYNIAIVDYNLMDSTGNEVAAVIRLFVKHVCFLSGEACSIDSKFPCFEKLDLASPDHPIWKWLDNAASTPCPSFAQSRSA